MQVTLAKSRHLPNQHAETCDQGREADEVATQVASFRSHFDAADTSNTGAKS
jgi:hypothetical protein